MQRGKGQVGLQARQSDPAGLASCHPRIVLRLIPRPCNFHTLFDFSLQSRIVGAKMKRVETVDTIPHQVTQPLLQCPTFTIGGAVKAEMNQNVLSMPSCRVTRQIERGMCRHFGAHLLGDGGESFLRDIVSSRQKETLFSKVAKQKCAPNTRCMAGSLNETKSENERLQASIIVRPAMKYPPRTAPTQTHRPTRQANNRSADVPLNAQICSFGPVRPNRGMY